MRKTLVFASLSAALFVAPFALRAQTSAPVPTPAPPAGDPADAIVGVWRTEPTDQGYAHVRVTRDGDRYRGEIITLSKPLFAASEGPEWEGKPKVDRNNPVGGKQSRPIIGLTIVWDFKHKGPGRWEGGKIYDPENGKTYKAKIRLQDDGTLDVRGFIGFSLLGRTTRWQPTKGSD